MKNLDTKILLCFDLLKRDWLKYKMILNLLLLAAVLSGCDGFVDVDLPNSQLAANTLYEDKVTADAAMAQVYAKMRDSGLLTGYSSGLSHLLGNYTDEFIYYGNPQENPALFYNTVVLPTNSAVKSLWNNSYNHIYGANAVLEGVSASKNLLASDRAQLTGEALFTRAFIHFYLTNLYGNIPYIKTTDYKKNTTVGKESSKEIYAECIEDLKQASDLLGPAYKTADRTRPNKFAVRAFLARVYLYAEMWDEASNEASAVLNNTALYPFETNLGKIFLKESTTTLWQFSPNTATGNTLEAQTFVFTSGPPPVSALTASLVSAFSSADKRKSSWIASISKDASIWYYPAKYKNKGTGTATEYSIVLRTSEVYLIRAEARAHAGDLIGSKEDLNKIRNNAGLPNSPAISQSEVLQAIQRERQLELFTEFGHRFFDLKRFGKADMVLSPLKPAWNTNRQLLPLPESELFLNTNLLPQNTGY